MSYFQFRLRRTFSEEKVKEKLQKEEEKNYSQNSAGSGCADCYQVYRRQAVRLFSSRKLKTFRDNKKLTNFNFSSFFQQLVAMKSTETMTSSTMKASTSTERAGLQMRKQSPKLSSRCSRRNTTKQQLNTFPSRPSNI